MPDMANRLEGLGGASTLGFGNLILVFIVIVGILFATYYVTKLIAGKAAGMMRSRKMSVIDRLALSRDKQLLIVKVGEEAHLIAISASTVTELALLPSEILDEHSARNTDATPAPGETFTTRFISAMKENLAAKVTQPKNKRPTGAYERARSEYERTLREQDRDSGLDDMSEMARLRGERFKGRRGDS